MQKLCEKHFSVRSSRVTVEVNDGAIFTYSSLKQSKQTAI